MRKSILLAALVLVSMFVMVNSVSATTVTDTVSSAINSATTVGTMTIQMLKASKTGNLSTVGVNMFTGDNGHIRVAIYSNNYGIAGTLLAESASVMSHTGWNDLSVTGVSIFAETNYFLAFQQESSSDYYYYQYNVTYGSNNMGYYTYAYNTFPANGAGYSTLGNYPTNMRMTYIPSLSNCTDGTSTTPTLNYSVLDENTLAPIFGVVSMTHNIGNATSFTPYAFTFTNLTSFANCINPPSATYQDTGIIQYVDNGTAYTTRFYWLNNWNLSSIPQIINLYLLPTAQGSAVSITLKDNSGSVVPGAYISIQRYYPSAHAFRTVEVLPTDSQGTTTAFMQLNTAYYRFMITNSAGVTLGIIPSNINGQLVTTTAITLSLSGNVISPYLIYGNQITGTVNYSETTGNVTALYSDTSGYLSSATLVVNQVGALQTFAICSKTNTTLPNGQIDCYIGNATGNLFSYTLTGIVNTTDNIIIKSGTVQFKQTSLLFGDCSKAANATACQDGAVLAFLLIVTLAFAGVVISPPVGLILTLVGLAASNLIGLIAIPLDLIVGVAVVAGLLIYKMRSGV
jgi:hypothetical protein